MKLGERLSDLFDMQQKSITDDYWVQKSLDIPLDKCKHQMTGKVNGIQISEHFEQNLNCERKMYRTAHPIHSRTYIPNALLLVSVNATN